ncbi:MAG: DNA polymerase III subunit alpha, partial [Spirochaetaceae bacterium]|nr:DNA polymerase III subunit alpha [Spirochaetaceae bacterium]
MPEFVHLHNHSEYSLLDGAAPVKKMAARAAELGMKSLALTDHGNMFGILDFYDACVKEGIAPVLGCEFYVVEGSRLVKTARDEGAEDESRGKMHHLVLLAKDLEGYKNLVKLSSLGYTEGFYYKPRIDDELLEKYHGGLVCSSACIAGEIPKLIRAGREDAALARAGYYAELFGAGNFYLEIQDHGMQEERIAAKGLVKIARKLGLPLLATNDMHYLAREHANAHDTLLCIGTGKKKTDAVRLRFEGEEFYMKTPAEMASLFAELPEALAATVEAAEKCAVKLDRESQLLLPDYAIPAGFSSPAEYLRHLARTGLAERFNPVTEELSRRLEYELDTIIAMGFPGYFLIVWDFIHYAKQKGIPVGPGRGSGAGSLVAYSLRITDLNPLKYNLIFERFLNPERISMPDFDIDFCGQRRQEVIDYVTARYGQEKVGRIITFGKLKAKSVLSTVASALDIPLDEANAISKMVPDILGISLRPLAEKAKEIAELEKKGETAHIQVLRDLDTQMAELRGRGGVYEKLVDTSRILEGLARNTSTHAGGVVIGKTDLIDYVPLYRDAKTGAVMTQYDMTLLEGCGLVKMDLLGLKTLTLIENAQDIVRAKIPDFDIEKIPEDDTETFAFLGEGRSVGLFQFESDGMQGLLRRTKPTSIDDLIALNALYRPGPMQHIEKFADSKSGRIPITYPLAELEPVLKETYGVIVYQEQVMRIAQIVAGFSMGKADALRRAMGKKKHEEMVSQKNSFIEGALAKGFSEKTANDIFELLIPFAGYGFNKTHAAAYVVLAYRTAYLKVHFSAEYMAATLTSEITGSDAKLSQYIAEAQKMGLVILPPDINSSEKFFTVVEGKILYGLLGIKHMGEAAAEKIVQARKEGGKFTSIFNFLERLDLQTINKRVLETSAQCGLFDSLHPNRAALFTSIDAAVGFAAAGKENRQYGQISLFGSAEQEEFRPPPLAETPDWPALDKLKMEKDILGYYFSGHPLDPLRAAWEKCVSIDLQNPHRATRNKIYNFIGMLHEVRPVITKKGDKMAKAALEDYNGTLPVTIFPRTFEKYQHLLVAGTNVGLTGKIEFDASRESYQIIAEEFKNPAEMETAAATEMHIQIGGELSSEEELSRLRAILVNHPGRCTIYLHMDGGTNGGPA